MLGEELGIVGTIAIVLIFCFLLHRGLKIASETSDIDVALSMTKDSLDEIVTGRMTFQRAFMAGNMKMKGDFKLLRGLDQIFVFG